MNNGRKSSAVEEADNADAFEESGLELLMPKFSFMPLHRIYSYPSGGEVSRTIIVLEINLPSGVGPGMYEVKVNEGGGAVRLECRWPEYLLNPKKFNGKWMKGTGDGTIGSNDARLTHSLRHAQNTVREYGDRSVKSSAVFVLPQIVEEKVESMSVVPLGFLDENDVTVKANGLALQIRLIVIEEFPLIIYDAPKPPQFELVKNDTGTIATVAPGSGLDGL